MTRQHRDVVATVAVMFAGIDTSSSAFVALTVIGTVAFAVSGVMAAAHSGMDWLGALVLAVVVAVGGGTLRDVLIGNLPVVWVDREWPVLVALGTAVVGIVLLRLRPDLDPTEWRLYLAADAIGLGAFAVLGTRIALADRASSFIAVLMGVVTGVGGGVIRDVVTGRRPMVLVGQIYAVAAIGGAAAYVGLDAWGVTDSVAVGLPVVLVVVVRALAVRFDWHLPQVGSMPRDDHGRQ